MSPPSEPLVTSRRRAGVLAAALVWVFVVLGGFAWERVVNAATFQRLLHRVAK